MGRRRLIVEADGGSRGNPGPAAYGAVVRDAASGEVLAEVAEHIGLATNNVAEYRGLIAGLAAARAADPAAAIDVRMDSKLVIEQMSGRWRIRHPDLQPMAIEARRLAEDVRVSFRWVPRERNTHADRLANEALDAAARGQPWTPRRSVAPQPAVVDEDEPVPASLPTSARPAAAPALPAAAAPGAAAALAEGLAPPTTFLLVRHGETAATLARVFSGAEGADPGLSPQGRRQAERVAAALRRRGGVDAVVSSPLRRARETAVLVAEALGLEVRIDAGFRECAFGAWEGLTLAEVRAGWPAEIDAWLASTAVTPPGGESFDGVADRVRLARDKTIARHAGQVVVVVTHGGPINLLVCSALGAPSLSLFRMHVDPASLTLVSWFPDGNTSLRSLNETGHLA